MGSTGEEGYDMVKRSDQKAKRPKSEATKNFTYYFFLLFLKLPILILQQ